MLYGNLIFIKKTGGDGSKFPVTQKDVKIGRSQNCLIRIYNPEVAPEHCQLIIKDIGQATLRSLSSHTILNGKPLGQGETILRHGDVFKIGTRSARWEYFPNSSQVLTPTGRQVAIVMPQQRSSGEWTSPGTSTSQVSALRNTPLGKTRYSERFSKSSSAVKIGKSSDSDLISKNKCDLPKLWTSRLSFKSTKLLLHGAKIKQRKSISGMASTKTPAGKAKGNSRKSTLPSWKVNVISPLERVSKEHTNSPAISVRKSTKSRKSVVKTPLKNVESNSEKLLSTSKSEIKATPRTPVESKSSEDVVKSASKSVSKSSLKAPVKSPSRKNESPITSRSSLSKSPSPRKLSVKSPSKAVFSTPRQKHPKLSKSIHSESKVNLKVFSRGKREMSLILDKADSPSVIKSKEKVKSSISKSSGESVADAVALPSLKTNFINDSTPVKRTPRASDSTPLKKTPAKSSKKSTVKKSGRSPAQIQKKTPRKSVITKTPGSPSDRKKAYTENAQTSSNEPDYAPSAKKRKYTPRKSVSANNSPERKTPVKLVNGVDKLVLSTNKKFSSQTVPDSAVDLQRDPSWNSQSARKSSGSKTSLRKSTKASPSPKGVRRKLSPNSDAERAAKKLKTSSPKKPDKNKKKALLVLGIASRKQLLSQNVKVLLKRKIVKKAIKQSTAVAGLQDARKKKNVPKVSRKKISKPTKKSTTVKKPSQSPKTSPVKSSDKEKTPKGKVLETSQLNSSAQQSSVNLPLTSEKSRSKQKKNSDVSGLSLLSKSYANESPFSFEQSPENYLFNSNRRCSKRLSSKNETDRPDFIELCPTALGLIPKNIEVFKTPKVKKRRSFTLSTPKNLQSSGIIKSASTSKIGNRKSVRFSSNDVSFSSEMRSPNVTENTSYDFTPIQTPNIAMDYFVSPLTDKSSLMKKDVNDSAVKTDDIFKTSAKARKSNSDPATCARKLLLSPPPEKSLDKVSSGQKSLTRSSRITASQSPSPAKVVQQSKAVSSGNLNNLEVVLFRVPNIQKSPKNRLSDLEGVAKLLRTPRDLKSPKNDLTDVRGVKKLFQTPKGQNSPKNDLTDVRGVKRLLKTPKEQRSPKNDLSDVRGVKKLLRTPKAQKSPKNDLTDLRGVKKLMQSPKVQKSPKNDLSDLRGVKKLMQSPKVQKSPKNDLSDLRGVKKLMQSPKVQKSPKNDLSDLRGVKKLMQSPKVQKSPRNDLSDLRGVKKLMQSPKVQKSPKNDLSNVAGVKQLLRTPRVQKSPRNELLDLRGVKNLLGSPSVQKSPKNELNDLTGVKALFTTPRVEKSPKNNLLDVSGVARLFEPLSAQKLSRNATAGTKEVTKSLTSEETFNESPMNLTEVKQLLISKSRDSGSKKKRFSGKITDYRTIRGRRVIYSTPKGPKNDLSDPTGVRELFLRHKPNCNFDISLTGVAELFELPKTEAKSSNSESETASDAKQKRPKAIKLKEKSETEVKITERGTRLRKVATQAASKRTTSKKSEETDLKEKKPSKRKAAEEMTKTRAKRANVKSTKTETKSSRTKKKSKTTKEEEEVEVSRKRKAQVDTPEASPPKLRRRVAAAETKTSATISGSSKRAVSEASTEKKTAVRSVKKAPAKTTKKAKTSKVQSKPVAKTTRKQVTKVQNRSQTSTKAKASSSPEKLSPRKTRSTKAATTVQTKVSKTSTVSAGKKTVKRAQAERASPVVKRSTRRK